MDRALIENSNFNGKWVRDMTRDELYELIDFLLKEKKQAKKDKFELLNLFRRGCA